MTSNKVHINMPTVVQASSLPRPLKPRFPVLVPTILLTNVIMFMVTMYVNNCPELTVPPASCYAPNLGRFSFQPLQQNPLLGPSDYSLIKMGALHVENPPWRLFTSIWLNYNLVHMLYNLLPLLLIGIPLENKFGFVRIGLLYVISGLGGNLLSVLFPTSTVSVGASGAVLGLLGGMLSELLTNWTIQTHKFRKMLVIMGTIGITLGTFAMGDNFSYIGGFISGFLLGFVILVRPSSSRKHQPHQYALCIISSVLLSFGLISGLVLFLKRVDLNSYCSWCHYLTCVPPHCNPGHVSCYYGSPIGNQYKVTCSTNGKSGIFSLSNRNPDEQAEELCFRLCGI